MERSKLTQAILNGASLSCVMSPRESEDPTLLESRRFNFIFFDNDFFFAHTYTLYRAHRDSQQELAPSSLITSYDNNNYAITNFPGTKTVQVCNIKQKYSLFEWHIKEDFEQVWHSDSPDDTQKLRDAIENGNDLKLALLNKQGCWSILTADLANIEQDSNTFCIRTETCFTPEIFTTSRTKQSEALLQTTPNQSLDLEIPSQNIYFACYSNGSYYTYADELRTLSRKYKKLKIFARCNTTSGKTKITTDNNSQ